jgi:3-deoxy-D-manno-octulosonic-acid transferase
VLFLYQAGIRIYYLLIIAASPFSIRARNWLKGRRINRERLKGWVKNPDTRCLWVHASSLGEFEQGRPVIEAWKERFPKDQVVVSFYSPSGFNVRKEYPLADLVLYLPPDFRRPMSGLIRTLQPDLFILVKYDFWPNLLTAMHANKVPAYLISGRFRREHYFFRSWGRPFLNQIRQFRHLFVQDEDSVDLLKRYGIEQVTRAGDTRVDAVITADSGRPTEDGGRRTADSRSLVEDGRGIFPGYLAGAHPLSREPRERGRGGRGVRRIILGSSWPPEEEMMARFWRSKDSEDIWKNWRLIIAPHDINEKHLAGIEKLFGNEVVRHSSLKDDPDSGWNILLVDSIGQLKKLYHETDIAVIGGGFGKGIHNILEPAAAGLPVLFGPNYKKFSEAIDMEARGAAFTFSRQDEFNGILISLCSDQVMREHAGRKAYQYLMEQTGATLLIIKHLMGDLG